MIGIAFDLRRTSGVRFGEAAGRESAESQRGGEKERRAGDVVLRLADVRSDGWRGLLTCGKSGHGHRGAHQLHEIAAVDPFVESHGLLRELLMEELVERALVARELLEAAPVLPAAQVADALAEFLEIECFAFAH